MYCLSFSSANKLRLILSNKQFQLTSTCQFCDTIGRFCYRIFKIGVTSKINFSYYTYISVANDSVKTKLLEVQKQVEAQTNHNNYSSFHYIISNRVINQNTYSASSSVGLLCASDNDPDYNLIVSENQGLASLTILTKKYQVIIWLFFDKSLRTSDIGMALHLVLSHITLISTLFSTENQIKYNLEWVLSLESLQWIHRTRKHKLWVKIFKQWDYHENKLPSSW